MFIKHRASHICPCRVYEREKEREKERGREGGVLGIPVFLCRSCTLKIIQEMFPKYTFSAVQKS